MLNHVTWPFFIALLLGLALIYYLIVLGLYYVPYWRKPVPLTTDHTDLFLAPDVPEDDFELAEDPVITDIDGLILDIKTMAEKAYDPVGLRRIFQAYPGLKDSPHRPAINELVVSECGRTGQHDLTEAEVDQCWS